ncbi:MAG TPA: MATE family efflux transporter [Opitutaceae bacterium]|nr:MATE family efflux transporter [Opitutaceae bacterium]
MSRLAPYLREIRPTVALAVPIIVGQVSQMLMGVTDSVMIGHAGTVPLAASSFGGNVFNVFYVVGIGMLVPVSIFTARAHGAERPEDASEYLRHGCAIAAGFGLLEMLLLALISTQLHRFGQPPEVLAIIRPFFLLIGASIVPVLVYLALRQFAEAMGRPWVPMMIMLGGVGLNVLLNWVFIYGHLGVPALGLTGAGISTLTSRTLGALVIWTWVRLDPVTRAAWPRHWFARLSAARLREMLHVGVPSSGMLFFEASAFSLSTVMVGWLGSVPLAAHQIAITCASMSFMFPLGLAMATSVRVSRVVGAGERHRLRPIAFGAMALGIGMTGTFGLAFGFGGRVIATWFVRDPAVIALAAQLLVVAALFQVFDGWQVTGAASLRAITDVRIPAIITFTAYWVVALPLGYVLGIRGPYGAVGMWIGIAGGLAFAAVFLASRFARLTARQPA